jgi:hypothetical protein
VSSERRDPDDDFDVDAFEDAEDADDEPLDDDTIRERRPTRDPDEVEADEELLLDRKELDELGSELDNPEGFADE